MLVSVGSGSNEEVFVTAISMAVVNGDADADDGSRSVWHVSYIGK